MGELRVSGTRFRVTPAGIDAFERDGAVVLRQLLQPHEIELLRAGIDENPAHSSPRAKLASAPNDPGFFLEDFCCWQDSERYRRFIFGSVLGEVGARLMRSATARLYHDHMLTKAPGTWQRTPWHQDQPYYNISGSQNCSFWTPVDPVSRESTLEFVAGSHRGPWLMPRSFLDAQARWFPEGSLAELPDIDADRSRFRLLGWDLRPGDAVCFHMLRLHVSGGVNAGSGRRRVFSVRLLGDDIRHAPRSWKTSPNFPGLAEALPRDAPLQPPLSLSSGRARRWLRVDGWATPRMAAYGTARTSKPRVGRPYSRVRFRRASYGASSCHTMSFPRLARIMHCP